MNFSNKSPNGAPVIFGTPKTGLQYSGVDFNSEVELRQQENLVGNPEAELQGILKTNKKKIRGWKRKLKALEKWKLNNLNLDIDNLLRSKYDYVKIWIDPFYRLTKRQPPNWFNKKIIEAFEEIFNSWEKELKKLNKPYYLKLWLFEPNFISSQIVCAIEYKINHYENIFYTTQENKKLALNKYGNSKFLHSLNFELGIDEYYIFSNDNIYTTKELENFKKLAYRIEKINDSEEYYFIKVGYVWLGHR